MAKAPSPSEAQRKPRLAESVIEALRADIVGGRLALGTQLPTEPGLIERFGVSRTVIREALAELRAAGLVDARQGKGVFVVDDLPGQEMRLSTEEQRSIPRTLEMLEFRVAIETEAAALAAVRRSSAQEYEIRAANEVMADLVAEKAPTSKADFDFHLAIARATNNSYYLSAMQSFGPQAIPRSNLPNLASSRSETYLSQVVEEHGRIADAISGQDPQGARAAMREHIEKSQERHRALARNLRKEGG
ncbi:FadR/GntR family transcriptional regulator [Agrobacterium vitis]|uniref:FadR/GntR family transcriptional regulator n=1 Tax=Agrobacterium vitis TaxID=373 RepID=UPI0012E89B13|nr:FadR/GntR family transcriptional regulator [Agrobacterium vitis]MVA25439.1 FCD domain-containing protein [Agrobacterium vitis]